MLHPVEFLSEFRILLAILCDSREPLITSLLPTFPHTVLEVVINTLGHIKLLVFGPAIIPLGKTDLFFTQGFAVSAACILFVGCPVSDVTVDNDQRGAIFGVPERPESASQHLKVVRIANARNIPPVSKKARRNVFRERKGGIALNRDVVIVINPTEIREPPMAGERGCFAGDSLHHAAIPAQCIHIEIKKIFKAGSVITSRQPLSGGGHSDAGCDSLPQRTSGGFHPGGPAVLRMSRTAAV